jgi:hypothetical protein
MIGSSVHHAPHDDVVKRPLEHDGAVAIARWRSSAMARKGVTLGTCFEAHQSS